VKWSSLTLAALSLTAAAALPASAQVNTGSITTNSQGIFNLAEAYPCTPGTYADNLGITPLRVFNGTGTNCAVPTNDTTRTTPGAVAGAAPGILSLLRPSGTFALNANCFAVIPGGQAPPCFVQAFRLTKQVPGSFKCPDVYGVPHFDSKGNLIPYQFFQFGSGVRTWWSLNFTQPGTTFILEVVSVCRTAPVFLIDTTTGLPAVDKNGNKVVLVPGGTPLVHKDVWTWRVVADVNTLATVINLMHGGAVGTLEIPCIIGEDMYDALIKAQVRLAGAIASANLTDIGNAIFDMEALIVSNCLFTEILNPLVFYNGPQQFGSPNITLPGNAAPTVSFNTGGTAIAGMIDTTEHPCCCKLLVDLEWITFHQGLGAQSPPLPVF
jgi:hypothetical protein